MPTPSVPCTSERPVHPILVSGHNAKALAEKGVTVILLDRAEPGSGATAASYARTLAAVLASLNALFQPG